MIARKPLARLVPLAALALSACCFGTHDPIDVDIPTLPIVPADPSLDAVWLCDDATVVDNRCPVPMPTLPSTTFRLGATFRTHDLPRFAQAATTVVWYQDGAERRELDRFPMETALVRTVAPGETFTWTIAQWILSPHVGWPVETPVHVDIIDAAGRQAASSAIMFTGPRTPRPYDRPIGVLIACRGDAREGPDDDPFCGTPTSTVARDPAQHLYATYSYTDPALFASGLRVEIELHRGHRWVQGGHNAWGAQPYERDVVETVRVDWPMELDAFAPGREVRITLTQGTEPGGAQLQQIVVRME